MMRRLVKSLWKQPESRTVRYLLPLLGVFTALIAQGVVQRMLPSGYDFPYAFFYLIAIFAVAWFAGYVPGVIGCLLTMVGIPFLVGRFHLPNIDPSRLILLIAVSLLVSAAASSQRRRRETLTIANDELNRRVESRTEALNQAIQALEAEIVGHKNTERRLESQLERMSLLDQITRAIGERHDLRSLFQVVIRSLEDSLGIDFGCVCLYDAASEQIIVTCVGIRSEPLAMELAMTEQACIQVDQNGLSQCVQGHLVYEPDVSKLDFPFPRRLASGGLRSLVAAPLLVESQVFGVLVAARNEVDAFSSRDCEFLRQLSEHVALAAHQAQIYAALRQAYDDLRHSQQTVMQQERLRALGQMASGIAHDINNAISPVALYTEMLLEREPDLSPRTRQYLETTQTAIHDVAHTVARMREFYRQQEPQLVLEPVDLGQMTHQVVDLTRARWSDIPQRRGVVIQLRTELEQGLPPIAGIESEVREALTNLIFNAVDAMPDGGTLTIRTRGVLAAGKVQQVDLEVADTGIGMDEETRRRCLEPFFTTKGERGTGLGLAMVYGVTQRHNAEVELESALGQGTAVRIKFPVRAMTASLRREEAPALSSRLRVLVVDDDPLLIKSLRDVLEADGHLVTTASGGQEGIDMFLESLQGRDQFAVVFTDLGMPYVDGRKVASAVKAASAKTPVIMLTGWGQRLVAEGDVPPHVDLVLNKPPKMREIRTALAQLVGEGDSSLQEHVA